VRKLKGNYKDLVNTFEQDTCLYRWQIHLISAVLFCLTVIVILGGILDNF
jgi:hypothetical protein